jgi:hypothetical protein
LSLAVILLQLLALFYCGFNVEKINRRIDRIAESLAQATEQNAIVSAGYGITAKEIVQFQKANREGDWLLRGLLVFGAVHLTLCYSLYIHFLRFGHLWTRLLLHANNISLGLVLPSPLNFIWVPAYLVGTRVYKHLCVAAIFQREVPGL